MAAIALPLANVILGLGNISAGVGFSVAEKKKMDELATKSDKLKRDVETAGNLYDHIYYLVAVNLERVKKALDKFPSDMLDKLGKQITSGISESKVQEAVETVAKVVGYLGDGAGLVGGLLQIARFLRTRKAKGEEPPDPPGEDPFGNVPLDGEEPFVPAETESSFWQTPKLAGVINGLNVAGVVFGVAGLGTTIGMGVWTLEKLNKAISDVEKKQKQMTAFQSAMQKALDSIVESAGLPTKSYGDLITMAATWKKISENFESYEKALYYAIRGYFLMKSFDDIKNVVDKESDAGKPFPEDGYPLAKTLADDIKYQFTQKKTDKQIVKFFATENPKKGLRFMFDEFFISSLRWCDQ